MDSTLSTLNRHRRSPPIVDCSKGRADGASTKVSEERNTKFVTDQSVIVTIANIVLKPAQAWCRDLIGEIDVAGSLGLVVETRKKPAITSTEIIENPFSAKDTCPATRVARIE